MTLNLPEEFFHRQIAIHVPRDHHEEFLEACCRQYGEKIDDSKSLLAWCNARNHKIWFYYGNGKFSAFTELSINFRWFTLLGLEDVLTHGPDVSDILDLL